MIQAPSSRAEVCPPERGDLAPKIVKRFSMDCMAYIMTNRERTVLYAGVTSDPPRRIFEHKSRTPKGSFTDRYNAIYLVWYGLTDSISAAIGMEKKIKSMSRAKKVTLVNEMNPQWKDLSTDFLDEGLVRDCHAPSGRSQ